MRKVHKAKLISEQGNVSALCFKRPRQIDLKIATWSYRIEAITCKRCLKIMERVL